MKTISSNNLASKPHAGRLSFFKLNRKFVEDQAEQALRAPQFFELFIGDQQLRFPHGGTMIPDTVD